MVIPIQCKCGKQFQLPDNLAGKRGRCPACGEELQIPVVPAEAAPEPAAAAAEPAPPTLTAAPPTLTPAPAVLTPVRPAVGIAPVFRIIMLAGAALLFISFFLPWWSISISISEEKVKRVTAKEGPALIEKTIDVVLENAGWYNDHSQSLMGLMNDIFDQVKPMMMAQLGGRRSRYDDPYGGYDGPKPPKEIEASSTLFGWHSPTGILAFSMGIIVAVLVLVPFGFGAVRRYAWVPESASALMMVPLLIMSIFWVFNSPMEDIDPFMSQGIIIGPILVLVGCLAILMGGAINGMTGLSSLEKR